MKVFLSWSGEKSKAAAEAFREFLRSALHNVEPWMSDKDIAAGGRWANEVSRELEQAKFGILFVTSTNFEKPWLLFEAGALGKTVEEGTFLCPYLIDLKPENILGSPLTQYQAKEAVEEDTFALFHSLNSALGKYSKKLDEDVLRKVFDMNWSELESALRNLPAESAAPPPPRSDEILAEILRIVRGLANEGVPVDFNFGPPDMKRVEEVRDSNNRAQETLRKMLEESVRKLLLAQAGALG